LIAAVNRADPAFTLHIGDFKSGRATCDDERLLLERRHFNMFKGPLIYTPGDNDWTDCYRGAARAFDPIERLDRLRALFFATPESLGQRRLKVARQSEHPDQARFVENLVWTQDGITFATLHMVGSNNNLLLDRPQAISEYREREAAGIAWINEIFRRARAAASPAVVIAAHGNPFVPNGPANGYTATVHALRDAARGFAGPVLFIHGDTHKRRLDQPFLRDAEDPVANFWRLEVFGYPNLLAMRVILDPAANPPVVTHTITTDKPLE
jgi:hypothetical protein